MTDCIYGNIATDSRLIDPGLNCHCRSRGCLDVPRGRTGLPECYQGSGCSNSLDSQQIIDRLVAAQERDYRESPGKTLKRVYADVTQFTGNPGVDHVTLLMVRSSETPRSKLLRRELGEEIGDGEI